MVKEITSGNESELAQTLIYLSKCEKNDDEAAKAQNYVVQRDDNKIVTMEVEPTISNNSVQGKTDYFNGESHIPIWRNQMINISENLELTTLSMYFMSILYQKIFNMQPSPVL